MRASVSLDGLATRYDVSVATVSYDERSLAWARDRASAARHWPLDATPAGAVSWLATARGRAAAAAAPSAATGLPAPIGLRPPIIGEQIARVWGVAFDAVLVMRVWLAGVAIPFLEAGVPTLLDADDDDAAARRTMRCFDPAEAATAAGYESFQRVTFPWFDRVLFASLDDAVAPYGHLPNAVEIPSEWRTRSSARPLELLFVGTSGYGPNRDALQRLRDRIMPALEALGLEARLHHPGLQEDVGPYYARAHIAVVPLRGGGGTRIKVLEAFARGCPVVATPTGARGLAVKSDRELVVIDDDDDDMAFAEAVARLAGDEERRLGLARTARRFVEEHHDRSRVGVRVADLVGEACAGLPPPGVRLV